MAINSHIAAFGFAILIALCGGPDAQAEDYGSGSSNGWCDANKGKGLPHFVRCPIVVDGRVCPAIDWYAPDAVEKVRDASELEDLCTTYTWFAFKGRDPMRATELHNEYRKKYREPGTLKCMDDALHSTDDPVLNDLLLDYYCKPH
jgi:hypothetical protein